MIKSKFLQKYNFIHHGFFNSKNGYSTGIYKSLNCGFGTKDIRTKFKAFYGKKGDINDLMAWHKFEENNPDTFIQMYQFWCQKL